MFPVGEANCFGGKKTDFGATAAIKQQRQLCRIWGGAALVTAGGMRLWSYDADVGGGRERKRRKSRGIQRQWKR